MMQTRTGQTSAAAQKIAGYLAGGLLLSYIWHRNFNLLGDFYDYSILTSACGQLHEGLKPYRDFSTPLQSLTIYLGYASELVFGRRYLALAYGNLLLGLTFYALSLRLLKGRLPLLLSILVAAALGLATFFQHGIIWYNSVAMMLLALIVWCCAILYRSPRLRWRDVAALCFLLFLSSMCKINFHLLGLGFACVIPLLRVFRIDGAERKKFFWVLPTIILSAVAPGPLLEILINGTTPRIFLDNVFSASAGRLETLSGFLNSDLYLGKFADYYPDNWSYDVYLVAILTYAGCACLAFRKPAGSDRGRNETRTRTALKWFAPFLLAGFLLGSMLLTLTNTEIQMLTASFGIAGLVAVFLMFTPDMSAAQSLGFKYGILLLSAYFFIFGGITAFLHSRVRFWEYTWTDNMTQPGERPIDPSAPRRALPISAAASISPQLAFGYFQGVRFTGLARSRMEKVAAFVGKNNPETRRIYWGPGLQILNRVYGDRPVGRFPLWYHFNVTVSDKDSDRIIAELQRDDYEWIVAVGEWFQEMPAEVRAYIAHHYDQIGDDDLEIYHRK